MRDRDTQETLRARELADALAAYQAVVREALDLADALDWVDGPAAVVRIDATGRVVVREWR